MKPLMVRLEGVGDDTTFTNDYQGWTMVDSRRKKVKVIARPLEPRIKYRELTDSEMTIMTEIEKVRRL